jgi:glycosyltransferase involved in cell wall biosynthesis
VTVTLNANQLRAHLRPLLDLPEVASVTLVADAPAPALPKLRCVVPPRVLVRLLGRGGSKLVVCLVLALRERPDWLVAFSLVPHGINAWLTAKLARTRVVYHMIGGPEEWLGGGWQGENRVLSRLRRPYAALEALLLAVTRSMTAVVVMGEQGRRALLERGVDPRRIYVIPPSVESVDDLDRPAPDYDIVSVGRLVPVKRPVDLLEACARIAPARPGLRAAFVGGGPLEASLRERAAQLGLAGSVEFLGHRDDVRSILRRSRVFALASRSEGLPVTMLEAMAEGLPVVVADVGEIGGLVAHGRNGFRFPSGDVEALAGCLELLLGDPERQRRLGEHAARDVNAAAGSRRLATLYRRLLLGDGPDATVAAEGSPQTALSGRDAASA